ncbi:MAG: sulfatase [Planctomycetes bacterium]|nr:sulfatase [Planctomycetota bacterium]
MVRARVVRGLALACALGLAACGAREPAAPRPDVLLVVVDTLRPDHLGFQGYERETAPFLAELAARGAVFERAFSTSSWTAPSTASVFTGLYPPRHGVVQGFFAHFHQAGGEQAAPADLVLQRLPGDHPTLPELFHAAGYRTYGLATNLNIGPEIGFDRGFDRFERLDDVPAAQVLARLDAWRDELDADDGRPRFLYLHLNDVHAPYVPRKRWYRDAGDERARRISAYDSEISYLDEQLREAARAHGFGADALVAVVSDHGEEFQEHGNWFHGFSLHRELNQVLLVLAGPGVPARRVPVNVSLVDVLPTLVDLAGLGADATREAARNGRSLAPLLGSEPEAEAALASYAERTLLAHREQLVNGEPMHAWVVLQGRWKLYEQGGVRRLYDLWSDVRELHDLLADEPEVAARLGAVLDQEKARGIDVHGDGTAVELDAELLERLSSLGYAK